MCSSSATPTFHIVDDGGPCSPACAQVGDFLVYYDNSSYDYYVGKVCASSSETASYSMEFNCNQDDYGYISHSPANS